MQYGIASERLDKMVRYCNDPSGKRRLPILDITGNINNTLHPGDPRSTGSTS